MPKSLSQIFFTKTGKSVTKWEQYLSMYEVELAPYILRNTPMNLLEIGVQNGGSLEIWSEYLPEGSYITGIDIDPQVRDLKFENANVRAFVQDATDENGIDNLLQHQDFDIIIDDGSHICSHVKNTFKILFRRLKPGGKYIIEDLHTSYFESFEGGYLKPGSSLEWIKSFVDILNFDYFQNDPSLSIADKDAMHELSSTVGRVALYDSVAVIEKLANEKTRPFRQLISGEQSTVYSESHWLYQISPESLKAIMFGFPAARKLDGLLARRLQAAQHEIVELKLSLEQARKELEGGRLG
ncbi:class I SAM-dependent methyltransferase [Methylobacterium sp. NEAU 140]|uniref:class I SAM-dependent methyltransferase n=1 Tax=Methylobacterium sp. NEAU 140 TaxID=3064945 RepID=UPI00273728E5|nr:class I SAM-dependent methyltransferase [Methylobacterium sp. NEAU 140]MDP4026001.1 class I SAM-dependent methyltransferase [Methylobacterium sp. NEAU 140]